MTRLENESALQEKFATALAQIYDPTQ